jgi:hypothetical protein
VGTGAVPRFTLFSESSAGAANILAQFPDLLDSNLRIPFRADGLWLVRPDGYVALAAKSGSWQEVAAFLNRFAQKGIAAS